MNKDQKAAVVKEVTAQIQESEAIFAVDYRGISVPQVAELREKLNQAGARFRVVKNTLTIRAAEQAGADELKELLEGPTAFTFVAPEGGDVALAAKALAQFRREHDVLEPKGGRMNGEPLTVEQIQALARLPARDVLHGQLVGVIASPITGLVRVLNALIAGLAIQLKQIADQGLVGGEAEAAEGEPAAEAPGEESGDEGEAPEEASQETEQAAEGDEAEAEAAESAGDEAGPEPSTEAADEPEETGAPSEGETEEEEG